MNPLPRLRRPAVRACAALAAVLATATALFAHDFWLVPDAFQVSPGGWIQVRGQTSSRFPTSESAVTVDRVAEARLLSAGGDEPIRDLSTSGTSLLLRGRPAAPGQRIVAVVLHPRSVRESPESFRRYLELEGAPEALERYGREGRLPATDSVTRRYAKYAKTFVEVGAGGPRAWQRAAGHPLELVPLSDPSSLRLGDTLAVRLLYHGRPLSHARLHAGFAPRAGGPRLAGRDPHVETDADGVARVFIGHPGLWNVRTLQIVPADAGTGADWDAHWATMVFEVAQRGTERARGRPAPAVPAAAGARSDSAEAAAVVQRYQHALEQGDSATALLLLAPDATILESGGVETRAEYRGHHLPGDIEFARAVRSERGPIRVTVRGDVAWTVSTSTTQGEFRGRQINSTGAELMVLTRTPDGWRISAIHWSSRARRQ